MSDRKTFDGLGTKPDPVPFDAHDQVVHSHHSHSRSEGYEPREYEHEEYPKHVKVGEDGEGKPVTVVAESAEEEKAILDKHKKEN